MFGWLNGWIHSFYLPLFRFAIPEALNTIRKAEEVLMVHFGPWNDEIQELQKMKSCLLDLPSIPGGPSVQDPKVFFQQLTTLP